MFFDLDRIPLEINGRLHDSYNSSDQLQMIGPVKKKEKKKGD